MGYTNGIVLWEGQSLLNGTRIVAIATGIRVPSHNVKTGAMVQCWVLLSEYPPHFAVKHGLDSAICGSCSMRRSNGGICYVLPHQAPTAVWRAFRDGRYPRATEDSMRIVRSKSVRVTAYGDPAAVPVNVWLWIAPYARRRTAFTHMWRDAPQLRGFAVASVDSVSERDAAQRAGWQTFLVTRTAERKSMLCRSATGLQCIDCKLCNGKDASRSIRIAPHGSVAGRW